MEKKKVVIVVQYGMVEKIITDSEVEVLVVDFDTDGSSPDEVTEVSYEGRTKTAYMSEAHDLEENAEEVETMFNSFK